MVSSGFSVLAGYSSKCVVSAVLARFLGAISARETPYLHTVVSSRRIPPDLITSHNRGQRVRCDDTRCEDRTILSTVASDSECTGDRAACTTEVASVRLDEVLSVPTTFSPECNLYIYRVGEGGFHKVDKPS